jgi:hypothetical protein
MLVVRVVCAGCVCAARHYCFGVGLRTYLHQKVGKPQHIGDCWKGLFKTN